jgi:hypothetical protein
VHFVRAWKRVVVAYFTVLYEHFPVGAEENSERFRSEHPHSGRRMDPSPPDYEAGVLLLGPDVSCDVFLKFRGMKFSFSYNLF